MSYEDIITDLGRNTERVVLQLWNAVERGDLPVVDFQDLTARFIATANQHGRAAAEVSLQAFMTAATGEMSLPTGPAVPVDDLPRLNKALATIVASDQDTLMQLQRIVRAEPLDAGAYAFQDGMARDGRISGWVRGMEGDACELCRWWWREGRVWPADHPMPRHTGCACAPVPTVSAGSPTTAYTRRLARAKASPDQHEGVSA